MLKTLKVEPRFMAIPVYMWSVGSTKKEIDLCLQLGAEQFIVKPGNDQERLKARIKLAELLIRIENEG